MKKILSTTAIAGSLCLLGTSAIAQTFSGPYVAISASMAGVATDGSKKSDAAPSGSAGNSGNAPAGVITPLGAIEIGYGIAVDKTTTIAIGANYIPFSADFDAKSTSGVTDSNSNAGNRTFKVKDAYSIFIQPTFEINKDAAFFAKVFYSHADTSLSGTAVSKPGDLEGFGGSLGLKVALTKNAFIQTEAVYTQYDSITAKIAEVANVGQGDTTATTRTFTASKPELIEGRITLGFKF